MRQVDWVGDKPAAGFRDIRNTRDAVAEEKARLCLQLGEMIRAIPERIKSGGSVNSVREWRHDREACEKIARNPRASANELRSAISRMERWA